MSEAVELEPCPFCGGAARTLEYNGTTQATCAVDGIECAGTDVLAPVAMWNRRSLTGEGEPVAWRWRQLHWEQRGPITGWSYQAAHPDVSDNYRWEVQPLYTRPVACPDREDAALSASGGGE